MKQGRIIKSLEVESGNASHVDIELYYSKGGMNYFSATNEPRGLYLSATPLTKGEGFTSVTGFSGVKKHVKDTKRFSQKQLDEFVVDMGLAKQLLDHVLLKNNIILKEKNLELSL